MFEHGAKGDRQKSPKKSPRDFSMKEQKPDGVGPSSRASVPYMALSWTISVPLELDFLKPGFLWLHGGGGNIVKKWSHASDLTIWPHFFKNNVALLWLGILHKILFEQRVSCFEFG